MTLTLKHELLIIALLVVVTVAAVHALEDGQMSLAGLAQMVLARS
jgi:hypothetical protein